MPRKKLPKAKYNGDLKITNINIDCSVLEDGRRVLSYRGVNRALGKSEKWSYTGASKSPPFLSKKALIPFISKELLAPLICPIEYSPLHGGRSAYGVPANLLPDVCDVWLKARDAGVLSGKDMITAKKAEILMRAFAHVGIISLVDEATGYQEVREKQELRKILEAYISKELLPWTMTFPHEFYQEMFRLKGWEYNASSKQKKPMLAGNLTKKYVYDELPDGVVDELKRRNPRVTKGARKGLHQNHHHRYLTKDVGHPQLGRQITAVVTLMKASSNWRGFERLFNRAFNHQMEMDLDNNEMR